MEKQLDLFTFPISEDELIERYEKNVFTAVVHDTVRKLGYHQPIALPLELKPVVLGQRLCGPAFTVKGAPWKRIDIDFNEEEKHKEMDTRSRCMSEYYHNCVPIWDCSGDNYQAQYGEMMSAQSMVLGCRGAIVDGGARDSERIVEMGFKVWYRYLTPTPMIHFQILDWQIPIIMGNVEINPGDILFADRDGIVCIPRHMAYDVLLKAEEEVRTEKSWREIIAEKLDPKESYRRGVLF